MYKSSRKLEHFACCVVSLALSACAASVPVHNLDPATRSKIKTIALLNVSEPGVIASSDALSYPTLGLVGEGIQEGVNRGHLDAFTATVKEHHTPFAETLRNAVRDGLEHAGYRVVQVDDFLYLNLKTDADAILMVSYANVGYKDFVSRFYDPTVTVWARMVDGQSRQEIYFRYFIAGYKQDIDGAIYVPLDNFHHYYLFSTMLNEFDPAVGQLLQGASKIGTALASDVQGAANATPSDASPARQPSSRRH